MKHFAEDNNLNVFRLPVAWQYLTNNDVGGSLNDANFKLYDQLVQGCLETGALCIVDASDCLQLLEPLRAMLIF
jgi:endoglucanase